MYSNLINLKDFFDNCKEEYCVIKMPDHFPNYYGFSDLDILCSDRPKLVDYTVNFLKRYKNITVKVHYPENGKHAHVDVYPNGQRLDLKFDFIDSFSTYKKNTIKEGFRDIVLRNKESKNGAYVPNTPCEMVIRMLEYIEYIERRPDKIKHLKYVESKTEHLESFRELWNIFAKEQKEEKR
jgi:hypothetical protein